MTWALYSRANTPKLALIGS